MKRLLGLLVIASLAVGCVPPLNYSEISQKISQFHPKSVVILPFTNTIGMESANDFTSTKLLSDLTAAGLFQTIVPPSQVKAMMLQNSSVIDAVTKFRTTWVATGTAEPKLAAWIAKAFKADTIIFGEVIEWSKQSGTQHYFYRGGVALRWVDGVSGEHIWKMANTHQNMSGFICIFDCSSIEKTMEQNIERIVKAWPVAGK